MDQEDTAAIPWFVMSLLVKVDESIGLENVTENETGPTFTGSACPALWEIVMLGEVVFFTHVAVVDDEKLCQAFPSEPTTQRIRFPSGNPAMLLDIFVETEIPTEEYPDADEQSVLPSPILYL